MPDPSTQPTGGLAIRSRWRGLGSPARMAIVAAVVVSLVIGGGLAYRWWTSWPPRLILTGDPTASNLVPLAFSPDGLWLATTDDVGLYLWDVKSGQRRARWPVPPGRSVFEGVFSPDGRTFVALTFETSKNTKPLEITLIDTRSGAIRATVPCDQIGWLGQAFSPDGNTLRVVTTGQPPGTHVVDVDLESGEAVGIRQLAGLPSPHADSVSRDGRLLASAFRETGSGPMDVALVWDLDADREAFRMSSFPAEPTATGFSPSGKTLALGIEARGIELRDVFSKEVIARYSPHPSDYDSQSLAFSPDGETIVSLGYWSRSGINLNTGRRLVAGHLGDRWMPTTDLVAIDLKGGRILGRLASEGRPVFSPDGRTLATCHVDGSVRLRDVPSR